MILQINVDNGGLWCNKLFSLVPSISFCIEKNKKLYVLFFFYKYIRDFSSLINSSRIIFIGTEKTYGTKIKILLAKLIAGTMKLLRLDIRNDLNLTKKVPNLALIDGWTHRHDNSYIEKHIDEIRKIFAFDDSVQQRAKEYTANFSGVTIGMHVRRGDYKLWRNGRYFYQDDVYIRIMQGLNEEIIKSGKDCRFLICSNEPFDTKIPGLKINQIVNTNATLDLCALSQCDYIVGPPSTYSQWASFIGGKPLCFIFNETQEIQLPDFSIIKFLDHFYNGNILKSKENGIDYYPYNEVNK